MQPGPQVRKRGVSEHTPESAGSVSGSQLAGTAPNAEISAGVARGLAADAAERAGEQARPPASGDDLCRLTVCGPGRSAELAVPVHVPLIDLLPALVGHLGDGLADAGLEHGGWVLQRLRGPPVGEDESGGAPGPHVVDGVATGIAGRSDRWRPEITRRLLTSLLAVPLAAGLALLAARPGRLSDV